jgi:6-phosphofructokinase
MEFIVAKQDQTRFTNFNFSVAITDAFMAAVRNDLDYDLIDPSTREVVDTLRAREVFDRIIDLAWHNGEPGVLFIDAANRDNTTPQLGNFEATNPCVTGDTWVLTGQGPRQVADLLGRPCELVVDGGLWRSTDAGFFATGRKETLALHTVEGHSLRLTADHPVRKVVAKTRWRLDSEWVKAGELAPGDEILLHDHRALSGWAGQGTEEEGYLLGLLGVPVVGVASTIDNDLYGFDYTIGFDTAVNVAIDAIDRIRDAAESHDRVFVVEVMGRDNGSIALEAAIATGADIVLTPELPFSIPELITHLRDDVMAQKKHHIIVMAEGAGHAEELARYINANLPVECRATVLGYVQRGGSPTRFDRILASTSGEAAVVALTEGRSSVVAGTRNGHIVLQDTLEAVTRRNLLKPELVDLLRRVSI